MSYPGSEDVKFLLGQRKCSDSFNIHPNKQKTKSHCVLGLSSYEKLKIPPPNVIPSEKHCSTRAIRLNKEMKGYAKCCTN